MLNYDVIIIGAGVGLTFVDAAIANGMSCALIEEAKLGGTCLTKGCIPSKVLVAPADMVRSAAHAAKYGVDCEIRGVDWQMISRRMWSQIDNNIGIEESVNSTDGVDLYKGTAGFCSDKCIEVRYPDGSVSPELHGDIIILCPGARTFVPPVNGLEEAGYITSESFFGKDFPEKLPVSIAIVGAGAIGAEFAHVFSAFGVKVYLIERQNRILPLEEPEISSFVEASMMRSGISVITSAEISRCEKTSDGSKRLFISDLMTGDQTVVKSSEIMVAAGVIPNTKELRLENTGIETDRRGWVITDRHLRTSVDGVWALGDINGKFQFRHKANYEAEIAVNNIFDPYATLQKVSYDSVPWAVFTNPQVAHAGMTEEQARQGRDGLYIGIKHYSSIAKGFAGGYERGEPDDGFVKLIADKELNILGAHIVGDQASVLIQPYVYLMNAGCSCIADRSRAFKRNRNEDKISEQSSLKPIMRSMVIHPSLSELTAWVIGEMKWVEY